MYLIVLLHNYKRTCDQIDQIEKELELFIANWSYSYDLKRDFATYQRMRVNSPSWAGTRPNVQGNCGHIRPSKDLPIVALTGISVGIFSLLCNFSEQVFFLFLLSHLNLWFCIHLCMFLLFFGGLLDSIVSSSYLSFVPTGCRYMMCRKRVPGNHPLIPGNHYATTHIQTSKKLNELESVQYGGMLLIGVPYPY